jgi:23S rRNA G2069 N7-methylase RlmK/C1962 C5-methylase RlmI
MANHTLPETPPALSTADGKIAAQAEMLANRLTKRFRHLARWARRTGTDAFRLYDRDIPEIPLVLDHYGGAVAGALYERPYEKDDAEEERWIAAMREAAAGALGIDRGNIFIKRRRRQRGLAQYEKMDARRITQDVTEGGLRFRVNLSDYLDTGLFLDRRLMRAMVRRDAPEKNVLNLFAYTGSFSVCAAAGGALTVSVDLSNTYLRWAKTNFSLNGFAAELVDAGDFFGRPKSYAHQLVRGDALAFIRQARRARLLWDAVILDPPAFSNSKKMGSSLDLIRDHRELIEGCLGLLTKGGTLWFSAKARQFKTSAGELETALAARFPGVRVTDLGNQTTDEDFRGKKTPLDFVITVH